MSSRNFLIEPETCCVLALVILSQPHNCSVSPQLAFPAYVSTNSDPSCHLGRLQ